MAGGSDGQRSQRSLYKRHLDDTTPPSRYGICSLIVLLHYLSHQLYLLLSHLYIYKRVGTYNDHIDSYSVYPVMLNPVKWNPKILCIFKVRS